MNTALALGIAGLANGAVYALVAVALVVVFKASKVANFAHGELATLGAFIVFELVAHLGLPLWLGLVVGCAIMAVFGVAVETVAVRPADTPLQTLIITLGLSTILAGVTALYWAHGGPYTAPGFFRGHFVKIAGVLVSSQYIVILLGALVVMVALFLLMEHTSVGLRLRASAEDRSLAAISGVNVRAYVSVSWAISGALAALAAALYAPTTILQTTLMAPILFKGYAAGIIGGLDSLPGAVLGGLLLGLVESFCGNLFGGLYQDALTFGVLIIFLAFRPSGFFGRVSAVRV